MKNLFLAAALILAAACNTPDRTMPVFDESNPDQLFHRTIVSRDEQGNIKTTELTVTRRQQVAELKQRAAMRNGDNGAMTSAILVQDPNCSGSAMWLFDQINLVGNELCFLYAGTADLALYPRPNIRGATWSGAVRSYWAGALDGQFGTWPNWSTFSAYEQEGVVDAIKQAARYVSFPCARDLGRC